MSVSRRGFLKALGIGSWVAVVGLPEIDCESTRVHHCGRVTATECQETATRFISEHDKYMRAMMEEFSKHSAMMMDNIYLESL